MNVITEPNVNITYLNTATVELKNGKPKESWMKNWTQDERLEKFFEWCSAFDKREDKLLKESHIPGSSHLILAPKNYE